MRGKRGSINFTSFTKFAYFNSSKSLNFNNFFEKEFETFTAKIIILSLIDAYVFKKVSWICQTTLKKVYICQNQENKIQNGIRNHSTYIINVLISLFLNLYTSIVKINKMIKEAFIIKNVLIRELIASGPIIIYPLQKNWFLPLQYI